MTDNAKPVNERRLGERRKRSGYNYDMLRLTYGSERRKSCAPGLRRAPRPAQEAQSKEITMGDKTRGLYNKFSVRRNDGLSMKGAKHEGCEYFVLDLTHDAHAKAALLAYANSCATEYPLLAADLRAKFPQPVVTGSCLFKKKPIAISATQWFKPGDHHAVIMKSDLHRYADAEIPWIPGLEGGHVVTPGDWIITGVQGEHYACKDDVFRATYEKA